MDAADTRRGPSPRAPELLAPAGEWEALRAAVANGADAVYFGLGQFNARQRATNFTLEELPDVLAYLHQRNVKGYITFNTLIFSPELDEAQRYAAALAEAGADAVIVQDLGLARLIHRLAPTLPIHASTQMTLTDPAGIELARELGIERVILARELSLEQIAAVAASTDMPLEVFVHGALCVSYSGQCLASETLWGRSANRGQCAQACRLPYGLVVDGRPAELGENRYILSTQDLAAWDRVGRLVELGVAAFKIEGRLKSAHYVAAATRVYRAAIDAAVRKQPFALSPQQEQDLAQSFSRGFTHGFLDGLDHQSLVHGRFPKSRGLRIGPVVGKTPEGVLVELAAGSGGKRAAIVKPGDGVVFDQGHPEQDEQGGRVFSVEMRPGGRAEMTLGRGDVNLAAIALGSVVWKTDDPAVRRRLEQSYARDIPVRREPVTARVQAHVGGPLRVTLRDSAGRQAKAQWDGPLERAQRHPLSEELLRAQLGRLGDTPFELAAVELDGDGAMAPKSVLNDLRRQVVEQLLAPRAAAMKHTIADADALASLRGAISPATGPDASGPPQTGAQLCILLRSPEQLQAVLDWAPQPQQARRAIVYCEFEDLGQYPPALTLARQAGVPVGLAAPRIIKPGEDNLLESLAACEPPALLVRNLPALSFFRRRLPQARLIGDYSLNVANELTAAWLLAAGLARITASYDLNWPQMAAMLSRLPRGRCEVVIHQHVPLFHLEHCVPAARLSRGRDRQSCGQPCKRQRVKLRDRIGVEHPLLTDPACRSTVYHGQAQWTGELAPAMSESGVRHFRVELLDEPADEAIALLDVYARLLAGQCPASEAARRLRALCPGLSRGTMDFE